MLCLNVLRGFTKACVFVELLQVDKLLDKEQSIFTKHPLCAQPSAQVLWEPIKEEDVITPDKKTAVWRGRQKLKVKGHIVGSMLRSRGCSYRPLVARDTESVNVLIAKIISPTPMPAVGGKTRGCWL